MAAEYFNDLLLEVERHIQDRADTPLIMAISFCGCLTLAFSGRAERWSKCKGKFRTLGGTGSARNRSAVTRG